MYVVVCINVFNFVFVQAFIFAFAQLSGWTSVYVSMHKSWTRIQSVHKFDSF